MASRGICTCNSPGVFVNDSCIARAFWSNEWVTDPVRSSETEAIAASSGVAIVPVVP